MRDYVHLRMYNTYVNIIRDISLEDLCLFKLFNKQWDSFYILNIRRN